MRMAKKLVQIKSVLEEHQKIKNQLLTNKKTIKKIKTKMSALFVTISNMRQKKTMLENELQHFQDKLKHGQNADEIQKTRKKICQLYQKQEEEKLKIREILKQFEKFGKEQKKIFEQSEIISERLQHAESKIKILLCDKEN